jgi:leucyl-tRNA synthetase
MAVGVAEPFQGLFTRDGDARTYQAEDGRWLTPDEATEMRAAGQPVTAGRIEKMSKSKKNTVDPDAIVDQYGPTRCAGSCCRTARRSVICPGAKQASKAPGGSFSGCGG